MYTFSWFHFSFSSSKVCLNLSSHIASVSALTLSNLQIIFHLIFRSKKWGSPSPYLITFNNNYINEEDNNTRSHTSIIQNHFWKLRNEPKTRHDQPFSSELFGCVSYIKSMWVFSLITNKSTNILGSRFESKIDANDKPLSEMHVTDGKEIGILK